MPIALLLKRLPPRRYTSAVVPPKWIHQRVPVVSTLYFIAAVLQLIAVCCGVWMVFTSERKWAWAILTCAMLSMFGARLFRAASPSGSIGAFSTANAAFVSALMLIAMVLIRRISLESRRHEEKLRESEDRYRSVVTALEEGILIVGPVSVLACNPAAERILGRPAAEIIAGPLDLLCGNLVHEDGSPFTADEIPSKVVLKTAAPCHNLLVGYPNNDSLRWLRVNAQPLAHDKESPPYAAVVSIADVTDQRQNNVALQNAKNAAEEANKAKDQFLAVLSHELRTPLTPVLATIDMLSRDQTLQTAIGADIQLLRRNVELEARLIDDLLDLTRISKGKLQLNLEVVDLHDVIAHVLEICGRDIADKGLVLHKNLAATHRFVRGDPARLRQVVWNLMKNAVKFTPAGGQITVLTSSNERLQIEVHDSGIGIDAASMPGLFRAFEQGDPTIGRQFGGLGLGLAITKALVDLHGGKVWADSAGKDTGARLFVELPLLQGAHAVPAESAAAVQSVSGLRILLIEDHADSARTMARLLKSIGHTVQTAGTVAEALAAAQSPGTFDLIISDIGLPDGTGIDFLTQHRRHCFTPAIALSGFGMEEDVRRSKAAGFSVHLPKPVNFEKLQQAIADAVTPAASH
jgi:signal transduction histidine kinase/CheY-like chemotaxis protein/drug/metabolite transporter superfamily protein YnfA